MLATDCGARRWRASHESKRLRGALGRRVVNLASDDGRRVVRHGHSLRPRLHHEDSIDDGPFLERFPQALAQDFVLTFQNLLLILK